MRYCHACERYLTDHDLVRGFKHNGLWVLLSESDIAALHPESGSVLMVHSTTAKPVIQAMLQDRIYYLMPADDSDVHAYSLLTRALREEQSVAVVTYTTYKRTHLGLLEPIAGGLSLRSLYYAEYMRTWKSLGIDLAAINLAQPEILLARRLVRAMRQTFVHDAHKDVDRDRLVKAMQTRIRAPLPEPKRPEVSTVLNPSERRHTSLTIRRKPPKPAVPKSRRAATP